MNETELKTALTELKSDIVKTSFVYARASGISREAAVKQANRGKTWFYTLPKDEQERLETLASELAAVPKIKAMQKLEEQAEHAAEVLARELDSRDARLRVDVAKDVLDRNGISKQTQKIDINANIDGTLLIEYVNDWRGSGEDNPAESA